MSTNLDPRNVTVGAATSQQAAEAQTIGDEHLQEALLGSPVGISDAPGYLAAAGETPQQQWAACLAGKDEAPTTENPTSIGGHQVASQEVIVLAEPEQKSLGEERAALVESEGTQWLITEEGRVAALVVGNVPVRVPVRRGCRHRGACHRHA